MLFMAQFLDEPATPQAHFIDENEPVSKARFVDDGPGIPQTPDEIKSKVYAPGSTYTPTVDEFRILQSEPKSFIRGAKNAAVGTLGYLKDTGKKAMQEAAQETLFSKDKAFSKDKVAGTALEAGARGTKYLYDTIVKPAFRRWADMGGSVTVAGFAPNVAPPKKSTEQVEQDAYQRFLAKLADQRENEKIQSGEKFAFPDFNAAPKVAESLVSKSAAELGSNVVDPTALFPALKLPRLAALGEKGAILAEKAAAGVEAGARATKNAARIPQKLLAATLPEDRATAGMITGAGSAALQEAGVPVLKTMAGLKAVEAGAALAEKGAQGAKFLAQTEGNSQFSRLWQMAHNADAPLWLRQTANALDKTGVETAVGAAALPIKGAARGATIGAGMGAVSAENPEELGEATGAGAALGATAETAFHPLHKNARVVEQHLGDITQFVKKSVESGTNLDVFAHVSDETMLAASTLDKVLDGKVQIKFAEPEEFGRMSQNAGASGFYDTGTKTLYVNTDPNLKRGPDDTFYHEVTHALADSEVANVPQIKTYIDGLMGPDRLNAAKVEYASKLVLSENQRNGVLPAGYETSPQFGDSVKAKITELDSRNAQQYNDPNHWIYSEIFAESGLRSLFGKDIVADVINSGPLKAKILDLRQKAFEALGVKFPAEVGPSTTLFSSAFNDVIDSPVLRREVYKLIRDRKNFIAGSGVKEPTATVTKEQVGKHPGVPVETRPDGSIGNDFADVMPDGAVILKSAKQVKQIEQARASEVEKNIMSMPVAPLGDTDPFVKPRKTVGGLTQVTGTKLGDWFYNLNTFGPEAKKNAKLIEGAIERGDVVTSWYQAVGSGKGNDYRGSVRTFRGALQVSYREYVPFGFTVTKTGSHNFQGRITKTGGNILVASLDLTSANRKAADWQSKGKLDVSWGGDAEAFKQDIFHYLRNQAQGLPGDTGLGADKKNSINAFLVGRHVALGEANPLRAGLSGDDKQGLIRTWRLDRVNTVKVTDQTRGPVNYPRMAQNLSPEGAVEPEKITAVASKWKKSGKVYTGVVHSDAMERALETGEIHPRARSMEDLDNLSGSAYTRVENGFEHGFLTSKGRFIGREEAAKIAGSAKQLKRPPSYDVTPENKPQLDAMDIDGLQYSPEAEPRRQAPVEYKGYWDAAKLHLYNLTEDHPQLGPKGTTITDVTLKKLGYDAPTPEQQASPSASETLRKQSEEYAKGAGLNYRGYNEYAPVREDLAIKIADAYEQAQHNPSDAEVKTAYDAFGKETLAQWDYLTKQGVTFEPWLKEGQPYKNSAEAVADVRTNRHLFFYPTEAGYGEAGTAGMEHPLLTKSGRKHGERELLLNDIFRAVHDYFGHAKEGYEFGPRGEYNAYLAHSSMYSDAAKPALAAETLGQNSWVNYGKHLRDQSGQLIQKGQPGYKAATERPYAQQKATLLPKELVSEAYPQKQLASPGEANKLPTEIDHELITKAREHFGVTKSMFEGGYLLPDGQMLDFSGRNQGNTGVRDVRALDHREIGYVEGMKDVEDPNDNLSKLGSITQFQARTRSIRMHVMSSRGTEGHDIMLDIMHPPTPSQFRAIVQMAQGAERVFIDLRRPDGEVAYANSIGAPITPAKLKRIIEGEKKPDGHYSPGEAEPKLPEGFKIEQNPDNGMWYVKDENDYTYSFSPSREDAIQKLNNMLEGRNEKKVPTFFSQLQRTVDKKVQGQTIPAAQLAAILRNPQNGIKAEEIKWSGIDDFLKGKQRVTKQEVMDFLKENEVKVEEVEKGEGKKLYVEQDDGDFGDAPSWYVTSEDEVIETGFNSREAAQEYADEFSPSASVRGGVKFSDYQLPGGENYKELLLTLPQRELKNIPPVDLSKYKVVTTYTNSAGQRGIKILNEAGRDVYVRSGFRGTDEEVLRDFAAVQEAQEKDDIIRRESFKSTHWDEKNVLAHVRFNDRTDVEGKKVLFVEEIQSDWHQKGKKEGYKGSPDTTGWTATPGEGDPASGPVWEVRDSNGRWILGVPREGDRTAEAAILRAADSARGPDRHKVPDAPFKKTWHELAFKRMLRYAAENGYDALGWTTGKQQADRYNLSNHIDKVSVRKIAGTGLGGWNIVKDGQIISSVYKDAGVEYAQRRAADLGGTLSEFSNGDFQIEAYKDGKAVIYKEVNSIDEIAELVGQNIADKCKDMEANKPKTFEGLDLEVGGEGMRGFYDKILPDFARKYGRKWGAELGHSEIEAVDKPAKISITAVGPQEFQVKRFDADGKELPGRHIIKTGMARWEVRTTNDQVLKGGFENLGEAKKWIKEEKSSTGVWSLPITPEMKKSVLTEGQQLFTPNVMQKMPEQELNRVAKRVIALTLSDGGTTFNLAQKASLGGKQAYAVSIFPERTLILHGQPTESELRSYIEKNWDLLGQPDHSLGTWLNEGKTYVDVSVTVKDPEFAKYLGQRFNQKAIFNLRNFEEIPTGGNGEAVKVNIPEPARVGTAKQEFEGTARP
jgi:hypothetical protein